MSTSLIERRYLMTIVIASMGMAACTGGKNRYAEPAAAIQQKATGDKLPTTPVTLRADAQCRVGTSVAILPGNLISDSFDERFPLLLVTSCYVAPGDVPNGATLSLTDSRNPNLVIPPIT